MTHTLIAIALASAAVLGSPAIAGDTAPPVLLAQATNPNTDGGGMPPPAKKAATAKEKEDAKAARKATGKELGKQDAGRNPDEASAKSAGKAKSATAEEKAAARSKRLATGKDISKDSAQRQPDSPTAK